MGKYMRKAKLTGEVAVMEVSAQSSIGVRTRARTLALQRLQKPSCSPTAEICSSSSSRYLQLRSRRLEKSAVAIKPRETPEPTSPEADGGLEVSFGENVLEVEIRDRNARETTPCSLIRDSEIIRTPGSTTRLRAETTLNRRIQHVLHSNIPTTREIEEFFSGTERLQQQSFIEKYIFFACYLYFGTCVTKGTLHLYQYKYNFDPVNDCPLPGRYEWEKLDS